MPRRIPDRPQFGLALAVIVAVACTRLTVCHADDPFGADPFGGGDSAFGGDDPFEATQPQNQAAPTQQPAPAPTQAADASQPVAWADASPAATARIEKVLDASLSSAGLEFTETPLEEVVDFLRDEYGIEIQIDVAGLDELGVTPDEVVTANLRNISLRSALRLMLSPVDLEAVVSDEVLLVTTEERAEAILRVGVYPVGDLVGNADYDSLIEVLLSTVASDTWSENGGGEAEVRALHPGLLVISQTQAVHEEVRRVLSAIRLAKQNPLAKVPSGDRQQTARPAAHSGSRRVGLGGGGQFSMPTPSE